MSSCDRFEREGLLALEKGLPLDSHFSTCPDCIQARADFDRLKQELSRQTKDEPDQGWKSRVRAEIADSRERGPRPMWGWMMTAAAAVLLLFIARPLWMIWDTPEVSGLQLTLKRGEGVVRRGGSAQPGDILLIEANKPSTRYFELRLYFNERQQVLRCSNQPPCVLDGSILTAQFRLDVRGRYQTMLLLSDQPLPLTSDSLDKDAGSVREAGGQVIIAQEIEVR
jgi:hypothetical protein